MELGHKFNHSMLVNKCGSVVSIREALGVGIALKFCFHQADKYALYSHRNPVSGQSKQSDNDEKQIDNRKKAEWDDVPELDPA